VSVNEADSGEMPEKSNRSFQRTRRQQVICVKSNDELACCCRQSGVESHNVSGVPRVRNYCDPLILNSQFLGDLHTVIGRLVIDNYDLYVHIFLR
jgi:hypothetical protein